MSATAPTPDQLRKTLRKLARQQGLDPDLAASALDPEQHVPAHLMNLLTEISAHLLEAAPLPPEK